MALVSAKCQSKLRALSYQVQHPEDWSIAMLMPDPLFVAKTECADHPETRLQDVYLKALAPFVSPDLEVDTNNCIVCAIKIYLGCTKELRKGWKRLFIACKQGTLRRSSLPPSPPGLPQLSAIPAITFLGTLHISSEFEPMTFGPSPPAGMPCKGLTTRHPACGKVAFPHKLQLLLPHGG